MLQKYYMKCYLFCKENNKYLYIDTHIHTSTTRQKPLHNPQKDCTKILNWLSVWGINKLFWIIGYNVLNCLPFFRSNEDYFYYYIEKNVILKI